MSSTSPKQQHCHTESVRLYIVRDHARKRASQSITAIPFNHVALSSRCFVFVCSQCAIPPLFLGGGWSRMTPAGCSGMREPLSRVSTMQCHSVDFCVEGKADQCRVMEKTACCCDTVGNECGIWRDAWSGCERRLQQRTYMTNAPFVFRVCVSTCFLSELVLAETKVGNVISSKVSRCSVCHGIEWCVPLPT